tara:strand:+ start:465 stop:947 length:483 start_codon:yes stop_codon:yes gene_type:complete
MGKHQTNKLENWQITLFEELEKPRTFKWGVSDCVCYAVDVVSKYTSKDFGIKHIGMFSNPINGYKYGIKYFKEHNISYKPKDTLNNYIMNFWDYHFERVHINFAQRGDIVATLKVNYLNTISNEANLTVGILMGNDARFVTEKGYLDLSKNDCQLAWSVK